MLESLIRLAQAHARLMFRNEVTRLDAITAILCIESSMTTSAIVDSMGNALHSNFAENPDQEYAKQERLILERLSLQDEFLEVISTGGYASFSTWFQLSKSLLIAANQVEKLTFLPICLSLGERLHVSGEIVEACTSWLRHYHHRKNKTLFVVRWEFKWIGIETVDVLCEGSPESIHCNFIW